MCKYWQMQPNHLNICFYRNRTTQIVENEISNYLLLESEQNVKYKGTCVFYNHRFLLSNYNPNIEI